MTAKVLPFRANQEVGGRYTLETPLGEGGIGVVWKGWQKGVERPVAIKFLKDRGDDTWQRRFEVEAQALGRLSHPNCVTVYDFGYSEEQHAFFLVTEFLEGHDLSEWRGTRASFSDILAVARQVTAALAYAHHHGIAHRDLKPENIFLVKSYTGETAVKVIDFGLAKLLEAPTELTQSGEVFGTPAYMSPEQIRGSREAGPASDLYTMGVILYELIDGRLPFWGDDAFQIAAGHIQKEPPPLQRQGVPPSLEAVVFKLLQKAPLDRFESALALYDALNDVKTGDAMDTTQDFTVVESPRETLKSLPVALKQTAVLESPPAELSTTAVRGDSTETMEGPVEEASRSVPRVAWIALGALVTMAVTLAVVIGLGGGAEEDAAIEEVEATAPVVSEPVEPEPVKQPSDSAVVPDSELAEEEAQEGETVDEAAGEKAERAAKKESASASKPAETETERRRPRRRRPVRQQGKAEPTKTESTDTNPFRIAPEDR